MSFSSIQDACTWFQQSSTLINPNHLVNAHPIHDMHSSLCEEVCAHISLRLTSSSAVECFGCLHEASAEGSCLDAGSVAKVLLACDTRPSSPALMAAAAAGVQALGGVAVDCGRLTTPQLHWQLRRLNQGLPWELKDYFSTLAGAYQQLVKGTEPFGQVGSVCPCMLPVPSLMPCPAHVMCLSGSCVSHLLSYTA